jgi:O-antigen/teichoic acid export membrane protein
MVVDNPSPPQKDPQIMQQAVQSIKWAGLLQLLPRLVTPVTTMVLAALLVPDDFGVVAAATLILSLANIVIGMGFGATVVQRRTKVDETATMAFWMSLFLALLIYGILWLLSPVIALFYKIAPLENVLRVIGLSLIISAFSTIPNALLQRELKFKKLFFVGVLPQIINGVISVFLAVLKFGYLSLVIGNLAGLLVGVTLSWVFSRWKPIFYWKGDHLKSIFGFSFWVMLSNFQSWFFLYGDNALAGYFFGSKGLGQYSLGFNIATLFSGMIISPISSIIYPAFSRLSQTRSIGNEFIKVQSVASSILFPVCFGLSALASPIVTILYGNKWPELGMIIQVISILPGITYVWSLYADAFRAIGHPETWTKTSILGMIVLFPLLIWTGNIGFKEFVIARAIGAMVVPAACWFVSRRLLLISLKEQLNGFFTPLLSSLFMFIFIVMMITLLAPFNGVLGVIKLGIISVIGFGIYVSMIRFLNKALFMQTYSIVLRTISAR